jgi:hypothetical protein
MFAIRGFGDKIHQSLFCLGKNMLETYKAILRGNKIKWDGEAPEISKAEQNVSVYIKISEENNLHQEEKARGQKMLEALERLASSDALADIENASEWQCE